MRIFQSLFYLIISILTRNLNSNVEFWKKVRENKSHFLYHVTKKVKEGIPIKELNEKKEKYYKTLIETCEGSMKRKENLHIITAFYQKNIDEIRKDLLDNQSCLFHFLADELNLQIIIYNGITKASIFESVISIYKQDPLVLQFDKIHDVFIETDIEKHSKQNKTKSICSSNSNLDLTSTEGYSSENESCHINNKRKKKSKTLTKPKFKFSKKEISNLPSDKESCSSNSKNTNKSKTPKVKLPNENFKNKNKDIEEWFGTVSSSDESNDDKPPLTPPINKDLANSFTLPDLPIETNVNQNKIKSNSETDNLIFDVVKNVNRLKSVDLTGSLYKEHQDNILENIITMCHIIEKALLYLKTFEKNILVSTLKCTKCPVHSCAQVINKNTKGKRGPKVTEKKKN